MAQAEQSAGSEHRGTDEGERKRNLILRELLGLGGKAKTSDISEEVGFSSALVRSHCDDVLAKMTPPLVERAEKERNPNGIDHVVYRLTPEGKTTAEQLTEDDISIEDAKSVAELKSEIKRLRERVDELEGVENDLKEIQDSQNELAKRLLKLEKGR